MQSLSSSENRAGRGNDAAGFTLIEMAVVTIILGLILSAFIPAYNLYLKNKRMQTTRDNMTMATSAIAGFRALHGRYPCPASFTANRATDPTYGHEGADLCTAVAAPAGTYIQQNTRTINEPGVGNIVITPHVRIGALPFRELSLDESQAFDGEGNFITYAVTQELAQPNNFHADRGGIDILNDQSASAIAPATSGHFILISHGEDESGAFTKGGTQLPCPAAGLEKKNCDYTNPANTLARFQVAQTSTNRNSASLFDDVTSYFTQDDIPLWQFSSVNPANIRQVDIQGKAGVAFQALTATPATLQIAGDVRASDKVMISRLCDQTGANAYCFTPAVIGGNVPQMQCAAGKVAVSISGGSVQCATVATTEVDVVCPGASDRLIGINPDGSLNCQSSGCPQTTVNICGTDTTLPATGVNGSATLTGGASYQVQYFCQSDSTWNTTPDVLGGVCTCTPGSTSAQQDCDIGFTGKQTVTTTTTCPSGTQTQTTNTAACVCVATTDQQSQDCPDGFSSGSIIMQAQHTCNPPAWSGYNTLVSNTCTCTPATYSYDDSCPDGYTGTLHYTTHFNCPNGPTQPGWWDPGWTQTGSCTCTAQDKQVGVACPDGYTGTAYETWHFNCSATPPAWEGPKSTDTSGCTAIPVVVPPTCYWRTGGTAKSETLPSSGSISGTVCSNSGQAGCGASGHCDALGAGGAWALYSSCQCAP
jgi:prepilin-type N-terminal cleavage/methylation domain-containing protein